MQGSGMQCDHGLFLFLSWLLAGWGPTPWELGPGAEELPSGREDSTQG